MVIAVRKRHLQQKQKSGTIRVHEGEAQERLVTDDAMGAIRAETCSPAAEVSRETVTESQPSLRETTGTAVVALCRTQRSTCTSAGRIGSTEANESRTQE
jgi:hypothetical protein